MGGTEDKFAVGELVAEVSTRGGVYIELADCGNCGGRIVPGQVIFLGIANVLYQSRLPTGENPSWPGC